MGGDLTTFGMIVDILSSIIPFENETTVSGVQPARLVQSHGFLRDGYCSYNPQRTITYM